MNLLYQLHKKVHSLCLVKNENQFWTNVNQSTRQKNPFMCIFCSIFILTLRFECHIKEPFLHDAPNRNTSAKWKIFPRENLDRDELGMDGSFIFDFPSTKPVKNRVKINEKLIRFLVFREHTRLQYWEGMKGFSAFGSHFLLSYKKWKNEK